MLIYLIAFLLYLVFVVTRNKRLGWVGFYSVVLGFLLHFVGFVVRWWESQATGYGYLPLSNLYESLVFFSWSIILIYLILDLGYRWRTLGVWASPMAALAIASTQIVPGVSADIRPLIPALQSNWLGIHVITCFLGYAAFTIAFGVSLVYLLQARREAQDKRPYAWLPGSSTLDDLNYKAVIIGFPLLTLGIITGAAWAHYAWGSYWSWDPKETWSLITWFIYAAFLHARYTHEWRGKKTAVLSIVGFAAVIFTYFGVSYLLSGLHSYI
jgi:cytochrome c-type biogenesis protein CcsB